MEYRMKLVIQNSIVIFSLALLLFGCTDIKNNVNTVEPILTVHKKGITDVNSPNFHGNLIKNNNWSYSLCIQCHAADFKGGITGKSCYKCHTEPAGPQACNTCHGDFNDPNRIAPPRDISGNTSPTSRGVGAHTNHLYTNSLSVVSCAYCHTVPASVSDPGHIGQSPATVILSGLAITNIASDAKYDPSTLKCSNVYCHGNFEFKKSNAVAVDQFIYTSDKITGNNVTVTWNNPDTTQAACGTCHGLPPTGHIDVPLSSCYYCHAGIVDQSGRIVDQSKHIDGKITITPGISPAMMQEFISSQLNKKAAQ